MERFYDVDDATKAMFQELINDRFPGLVNTRIKLVMDAKTKVDKLTGQVRFAYIKTANEIEKYLADVDGQPLDAFIFISEMTWDTADIVDKKRILSHELCHAFIDENGKFKIIDHDINDFLAEVERNADEPRWGERLALSVRSNLDSLKEKNA